MAKPKKVKRNWKGTHAAQRTIPKAPPGYERHHKNGNVNDNRPSNLELLRDSEHAKKDVKLGKWGTTGKTKLSNEQIASIRSKKNTAAADAAKYDLSLRYVKRIRARTRLKTGRRGK